MAKSKVKNRVIGSWAFLIGVILAVILGFFGGPTTSLWLLILVVIGLIVGLLNVTEEESMPFLISGAVLIIASSLGKGVFQIDSPDRIIQILTGILASLLAIFVPATIIVAIKNVFVLARD